MATQSPIHQDFKNISNKNHISYVAIGSSTGGPTAITEILRTLPANLPVAIFIVQHIPEGFTASFAKRLNKISPLMVKEAQDNEVVKPGTVYLAPSGLHMTVHQTTSNNVIQLKKSQPVNSVRPSIDVLMTSVAKAIGKNSFGILLTGMGKDGVEGLANIKKEGGYTIAQDRKTSIVFGMPKAAIQRRVVDSVLPLYEISDALIKAVM
jgi:two-component system chemotaxis response regulator CheB